MKNTEMESGLLPTLEECQQMTFLPQIVGALDSHAKTSALPTQQEETDFKEIVQACFSELCTFLDKSQKKKDPTPYSLKMLEICLALMGDGTSPGFSLKWIGGGYDAEWQILNSKHFGSAQNRERLFIVGHIRKSEARRVFPIEKTTNGVLKTIQCDTSGKGLKSQQERIYLPDGIMCCLPNARAETKCATVIDNDIHILTAKERLRLQGFDDEYIERAYFINRPKELVKQAGNSVTVNVIEMIARRLA